MNKIAKKFSEQIKRKAIIFDIGGFRPPEDPLHSWFGKVSFCVQDEEWPLQNGDPMHALAQINICQLPFRTPGLEDIDFIAIFVGPHELPIDAPNGQNWVIRVYKDISKLVSLKQVNTSSYIKSFPMNYRVIDDDYPCWEDVAFSCPEEISDDYYDLFDNSHGFKLGGWPSLIQSEIYWAPWNKHETEPKYVFQIDTTEKGNWMWGDNGIGYFGRGTAKKKKEEWALEWQCY